MSRTPWPVWVVVPVLLSLLALAGCSVAESDSADSGQAPDAALSPSTTSTPASTPSATRTHSSMPSISIPSDLPTAKNRGLVTGGDASWPQCPKGMGIAQKRSEGAPMPLTSSRFVILGLTNGPGFYANPCLSDQVAWVKQRHLRAAAYSVLSFPSTKRLAEHRTDGPYDGSTAAGALRNVGYAQAQFNVASMRTAGLESPIVWLDVEPVTGFDWSGDPAANAAVVQGARRGYEEAGYEVGVYSTAHMWHEIVGGLRLGVPEWRPAGGTSRAEALRRCRPDAMIQGGDAVFGQWVENGRDLDVTCPGASTYLDIWFHQY